MSKLIDLTEQKFGRLKVLHRINNYKSRHAQWHCKCDCGKEVDVTSDKLKSGHTRSCGCLKQDFLDNGGPNKTHGDTKTHLYRIWAGILRRCENPNCEKFKKDYQDRGIMVCPEWHDFETFRDWAIANGYSENLTIDRRDNDKGYSPENCRWATKKVQGNNKRNNINITYEGQTHTLAQWVKILGTIKYGTLYNRIIKGWSIEDAINIPVGRVA
jgi:hypothetical protein